MRRSVYGTIGVGLLILAGCSVFKEAYRVDPVVIEEETRTSPVAKPFRWLRELFGDPPPNPIVLTDYVFPASPLPKDYFPNGFPTPPPAGALSKDWIDRKVTAYALALHTKEARNALAQRIVARSHQLCIQHMSDYVSQQALNELGLGAMALGLTAAGSVVGPLGAAQAIAAAATAVAGSRVLVNDSVYYKQLTPVLLARASLQRDLLLVGISKKLQTASLDKENGPPEPCNILLPVILPDTSPLPVIRPAPNASGTPTLGSETVSPTKDGFVVTEPKCVSWKQYPIDDVIADLKVFHDSCSFYRALQIAARDIQGKSDEIAREIAEIYEAAKKPARTAVPKTKVTGTPKLTATPAVTPVATP